MFGLMRMYIVSLYMCQNGIRKELLEWYKTIHILLKSETTFKHKRLKRTTHNMRIFGVIPLITLQNDT